MKYYQFINLILYYHFVSVPIIFLKFTLHLKIDLPVQVQRGIVMSVPINQPLYNKFVIHTFL